MFNFPIYISDNNSSDHTTALVKNKQAEYDKIIYQRNDKNLGYAGNVLKVIQMGKTEYIWLFGDDDILYPDSIESIYDKLKSNPDFLFINSSRFDKKMNVELKHKIINVNSDVVIASGKHNCLLDLVAKMDKGYLGFMGSIIIKRDILLSTLTNSSLDRNSEFIHLPLFYQSIYGANGIIVEKPIIKIRGGNHRTNMLTWLWEYPRAINTLEPYYSQKVLLQFYSSIFQYDMFLSVIEHRFLNNFSIFYLLEVFKERGVYINYLTRMASVVVAIIPFYIFKKIYCMIKKLKISS